MTFAINIEKENTSPIFLLEIDSPVQTPILMSYAAGIWVGILTPGIVTVTDDYGIVGYYENTNALKYNVQSLKIGLTNYTKTTSIDNCIAQNASFYFDITTSKIYLHFDEWEPPLDKVILFGNVIGYSSKVDQVKGAYYNDIFYDPRIKNAPQINKSKDPLFFGAIAFNSLSINLANNDQNFDDIDSYNIFRQPARILFGFEGDDYSEFKRIFVGYIEDYTRDFDTFTVNVQDIRKSLSRPTPINVLTRTEFPYLDEGNIDEPKPYAYGNIKKAPLICLNELEGDPDADTYDGEDYPEYYTFMLADTENNSLITGGVSAIFEADEDITSLITYSVDYDTGILSILATDINDLTEIAVSFQGYDNGSGSLINNAMDITKDLMLNVGDISFISDNYDIAQWNLTTALSKNLGIFMNSQEPLIDIIGNISDSNDSIFDTDITGLYRASILDTTKDHVKTINSYEWIGEPKISNNSAEFLSSCKVKYNQDLYNEEYLNYINTDFEEDAVTTFKAYQQRDFESYIDNQTDAIKKSNLIMGRSAYINNIVQRVVKMSHYDLELGDFIKADPCRRYSNIEDFDIFEVIGKQINLTKYEITLTLSYIRPFTETSTVYTQGWGFYNFGFNTFGKGYGITQYNEV